MPRNHGNQLSGCHGSWHIWLVGTGEFDVVRATLSALLTDGRFQAFLFMMAKPLAVVTPEGVGDVWNYSYISVAYFQFLRDLRSTEGQNICICGDDLVVSFQCNSFNVCYRLSFQV